MLADIIEADNNGNLERVLSFYSENAILMPSGRQPLVEIKAIRENYEAIFSRSQLFLSTEAVETLIADGFAVNVGYTRGQIVSKIDSSITDVDDKYVMILKKDSRDTWQIDRLIWNNN